MTLLLLLACATVGTRTQLTGRLEPTWWYHDPGFGEHPNDELSYGYVLRLDTPYEGAVNVVYLPRGYGDLQPDVSGAACAGGHARVDGRFETVGWPKGEGAVTRSRVVQCEPAPVLLDPPLGQTATVTGTFRRWWWYLEPGYGANPLTDDRAYGTVLFIDGSPVPLFGKKDPASREGTRRFSAACDGQTVTVTARWEPAANARSASRYKLVDATFDGPCAQPKLDRPATLGAKPVSPEWLMEPMSAGGG